MPADYSIKLDVLRALVAERHARLISQIYLEEAKPEPDPAIIAALEAECDALPWWGSYPDEQQVDAEIQRWKAIIQEQRAGG